MKSLIITLSLVIGLLLAASCKKSSIHNDDYISDHTGDDYAITQEIVRNAFVKGGVALETAIWHDMHILHLWNDPVNDSIKCVRYNQAKTLVFRYRKIDNLKCE